MNNDYKNKKVVVMGLGLHGGGVGSARYYAKMGAEVLVTDLKSENDLAPSIKQLKKYSNIKFALGRHSEEDFKSADLVIKNPAVPSNNKFLSIAKDSGAKIATDMEIFVKNFNGEIIGITGTKGKTTVSYLIHHIIKKKFKDAVLAGNLGISPLNFLGSAKKERKAVIEFSSFELEGLAKSPHISIITPLYPDHLDRYKNFDAYIEAKKNIFKYQGDSDFLILNYDDKNARNFKSMTKANVLFYCTKEPAKSKMGDFCWVRNNIIYLGGVPLCKTKDLKIFGSHNVSNVMAAIQATKIIGISNSQIKSALKSFKGVPHRQEFIKEIKSVKYFNDTAATMPEAAISAIKTFKERFPKSNLIMIAGGVDKGLEYKNLSREIKKSVDLAILLPGTATEKILPEIKKFITAESMNDAVKLASENAKKGDVVFLSPGAASFNLFKNEFDRGNQFIKCVKKIK